MFLPSYDTFKRSSLQLEAGKQAQKIELNAHSNILNMYVFFIYIKFSLRKWNKQLYVENIYCY